MTEVTRFTRPGGSRRVPLLLRRGLGLGGVGWGPGGEGLEWVKDGRIGLGGELPVKTSGGMMSEAYLQGWNNHIEAVRQLRWEAGERQVPNCRSILYWCLSMLPNGSVLVRGD